MTWYESSGPQVSTGSARSVQARAADATGRAVGRENISTLHRAVARRIKVFVICRISNSVLQEASTGEAAHFERRIYGVTHELQGAGTGWDNETEL